MMFCSSDSPRNGYHDYFSYDFSVSELKLNFFRVGQKTGSLLRVCNSCI